jgi:hypothetical protein
LKIVRAPTGLSMKIAIFTHGYLIINLMGGRQV